ARRRTLAAGGVAAAARLRVAVAVDGAHAREVVEQIRLVENEQPRALAGADLLERVLDGAHHRGDLPFGGARAANVQDQRRTAGLLERRRERVDQLVGQLADEADGVAEEVGAPPDRERPRGRVERLEETI